MPEDMVKCPTCGAWLTIDMAKYVEDEERPEKCPGTTKENHG